MKKQAKEIFQYALATLIVLCFFAFLVLLIYKPILTPNSETLNIAAGALMSAFGMIIGYFFGSSVGSQRKTDIIAEQNENDNN